MLMEPRFEQYGLYLPCSQSSFCLTKSKALAYLWDFKSKQASPELT